MALTTSLAAMATVATTAESVGLASGSTNVTKLCNLNGNWTSSHHGGPDVVHIEFYQTLGSSDFKLRVTFSYLFVLTIFHHALAIYITAVQKFNITFLCRCYAASYYLKSHSPYRFPIFLCNHHMILAIHIQATPWGGAVSHGRVLGPNQVELLMIGGAMNTYTISDDCAKLSTGWCRFGVPGGCSFPEPSHWPPWPAPLPPTPPTPSPTPPKPPNWIPNWNLTESTTIQPTSSSCVFKIVLLLLLRAESQFIDSKNDRARLGRCFCCLTFLQLCCVSV